MTGASKNRWAKVSLAALLLAGIGTLGACSTFEQAFDSGSSGSAQSQVQVSTDNADLYQRGGYAPPPHQSQPTQVAANSGAGTAPVDGGASAPVRVASSDPGQSAFGVNEAGKDDAQRLASDTADNGAVRAGGGPQLASVTPIPNGDGGNTEIADGVVYANTVPPGLNQTVEAPGAPAGSAGKKVPEKDYADRDSFWDWTKIDLGRHTREETPVERLRRSRQVLRNQQRPSYSSDNLAFGLRGSEGGSFAASTNNPAAAPRLGAATAGGGFTDNAPAGGAPEYAALRDTNQIPDVAAVPTRDQPMRIYFAPGVAQLSSQTINGLAGVAQTQKNVRRPVHVVGVAGSVGGEGPDFQNASALNELALSRAKAVAQELSVNGVPQGDIVVHAQQENRDVGAGAARARRVDIYLEQ